MLRKERIKKMRFYGKAVLVGVAIGLGLVLITPKCESVREKDLINMSSQLKTPGLDFVLDSLSAEGYASENHYPIFVRLVKHHLGKDPFDDAVAIAKSLKAHTGTPVKVQLDFHGGKVFAHPDKGIIDPLDLIDTTGRE